MYSQELVRRLRVVVAFVLHHHVERLATVKRRPQQLVDPPLLTLGAEQLGRPELQPRKIQPHTRVAEGEPAQVPGALQDGQGKPREQIVRPATADGLRTMEGCHIRGGLLFNCH